MGQGSGIGISGYDSFHFVVENLDRSREFYTKRFGFKEVARASPELAQRGQESVVYGAGDVRVCVSTPLSQTSKAARYLRRHPDGVMSISFNVESLDHTMAFLEKRGGTFLSEPLEAVDDRGGKYRSFEIATPLGDVAFRFVERKDFRGFAPGFVDSGVGNVGRPENDFGITSIDHVTSNGLTMQPIVGWYRDVRLGFEPFHQGDQLPHAGRHEGARAAAYGLGPQVDRDVGPGERREVRDQRAAPPLLPRVADRQVRRGQLRKRHPAHCVRRAGHRIRSVEELEEAQGGVHGGRTRRTSARLACASGAARAHQREARSSRSSSGCRFWSTGPTTSTCSRSSCVKRRRSTTSRVQGRSSMRSSSAREIQGSDTGTSVLSSRASSGRRPRRLLLLRRARELTRLSRPHPPNPPLRGREGGGGVGGGGGEGRSPDRRYFTHSLSARGEGRG